MAQKKRVIVKGRRAPAATAGTHRRKKCGYFIVPTNGPLKFVREVESAPASPTRAPSARPPDETEAERLFRRGLLEVEHRRRMEYARLEHERRMEVIEAEAALVDARCRRLAEEITPSNDRLRKLVGTFAVAPGAFDDEESPY